MHQFLASPDFALSPSLFLCLSHCLRFRGQSGKKGSKTRKTVSCQALRCDRNMSTTFHFQLLAGLCKVEKLKALLGEAWD